MLVESQPLELEVADILGLEVVGPLVLGVFLPLVLVVSDILGLKVTEPLV